MVLQCLYSKTFDDPVPKHCMVLAEIIHNLVARFFTRVTMIIELVKVLQLYIP